MVTYDAHDNLEFDWFISLQIAYTLGSCVYWEIPSGVISNHLGYIPSIRYMLVLWVGSYYGSSTFLDTTTLYLDYPSSWNSENCLVTLSSLHTINHQRSTKNYENAGLLLKMIIQVINLLMISLSNTIISILQKLSLKTM